MLELWVRTAVVILGISAATAILFLVHRSRRCVPRVLDAAVACHAVVVAVLALELMFTFVPRSHGVGYTYASTLWFRYYWKPINSLKYRDREFEAADNSRKKVIVVGDSFTAGHGIKDAKLRFSDRLQDKIGAGYRVFNLGRNGSDTRDEMARLRKFPYKPDVLVLQYYLNDIEAAAKGRGLSWPGFELYGDLNGLERRLVARSALLNYFYWRLPRKDLSPYTEFLLRGYNDPVVLADHLKDLDEFAKYGEERHAPVVLVLIPFLFDLPASRALLGPIRTFAHQRNWEVVDVAAYAEQLTPSERVVNNNDPHASEQVHEWIAGSLSKVISEMQ
jgi:hypothetical protein